MTRGLVILDYNIFSCSPPRYMGEGFVVLQSQVCQVTYLQDEPGIAHFFLILQ